MLATHGAQAVLIGYPVNSPQTCSKCAAMDNRSHIPMTFQLRPDTVCL